VRTTAPLTQQATSINALRIVAELYVCSPADASKNLCVEYLGEAAEEAGMPAARTMARLAEDAFADKEK
jgi:hypothetical protein